MPGTFINPTSAVISFFSGGLRPGRFVALGARPLEAASSAGRVALLRNFGWRSGRRAAALGAGCAREGVLTRIRAPPPSVAVELAVTLAAVRLVAEVLARYPVAGASAPAPPGTHADKHFVLGIEFALTLITFGAGALFSQVLGPLLSPFANSALYVAVRARPAPLCVSAADARPFPAGARSAPTGRLAASQAASSTRPPSWHFTCTRVT